MPNLDGLSQYLAMENGAVTRKNDELMAKNKKLMVQALQNEMIMAQQNERALQQTQLIFNLDMTLDEVMGERDEARDLLAGIMQEARLAKLKRIELYKENLQVHQENKRLSDDNERMKKKLKKWLEESVAKKD